MLEQVELEDWAKALLSMAVVPAQTPVSLRILRESFFPCGHFLGDLIGNTQDNKKVAKLGSGKKHSFFGCYTVDHRRNGKVTWRAFLSLVYRPSVYGDLYWRHSTIAAEQSHKCCIAHKHLPQQYLISLSKNSQYGTKQRQRSARAKLMLP